jgi:hypothetical protein
MAVGTASRSTRPRRPVSSRRYPIAPVTDPGTRPSPLETLAVSGGNPSASSTGNVTRVPDPTTVLIIPAQTPATAMMAASPIVTAR